MENLSPIIPNDTNKQLGDIRSKLEMVLSNQVCILRHLTYNSINANSNVSPKFTSTPNLKPINQQITKQRLSDIGNTSFKRGPGRPRGSIKFLKQSHNSSASTSPSRPNAKNPTILKVPQLNFLLQAHNSSASTSPSRPNANNLTMSKVPQRCISVSDSDAIRSIPKTLGSYTNANKPPKMCSICDTMVEAKTLGPLVEHIWSHIIDNGDDPKEVNTFFCDVSDCEFYTNSIDEANFHNIEGHTVIDNCENTDHLFRASIGQCFTGLDEVQQEKIFKARHFR